MPRGEVQSVQAHQLAQLTRRLLEVVQFLAHQLAQHGDGIGGARAREDDEGGLDGGQYVVSSVNEPTTSRLMMMACILCTG